MIMDLRGKDLKKVLAELLREEDGLTLTLGTFMQKFGEALQIDSARAEEYKPQVVAEWLTRPSSSHASKQTFVRNVTAGLETWRCCGRD